jgi:hypothetical protein
MTTEAFLQAVEEIEQQSERAVEFARLKKVKLDGAQFNFSFVQDFAQSLTEVEEFEEEYEE